LIAAIFETTQILCLATMNQPHCYNNRLLLLKREWFGGAKQLFF